MHIIISVTYSISFCVAGNPWPPVLPHVRDLSGTLVNVLLREAKKDYHNEKKNKEIENIQETKISSSDAKNNVDSDRL